MSQPTPLPVLILDGGLGTTLEDSPHDVRFTSHMPLWSSHLLISDPSTLCRVHREFIDAGADIILTATYQTSIQGFEKTDPNLTSDDAAAYMRSAVQLAHNACKQLTRRAPPRIALSLGPYGATVTPVSAEYSGVYPPEMDSEDSLCQWHSDRLRIFATDPPTWDGIHFVAFETIKRMDEVRAIRRAVGTVMRSSQPPSGKPWWITGVFPTEEVDEKAVREWVRAALDSSSPGTVSLPRPWGVGVNCTTIGNIARIVGIMEEEVVQLIDPAQHGVRPWLVLYPDGTRGERYDPVMKKWVEKESTGLQRAWEDVFAEIVCQVDTRCWEGVIAGGCCRTGPRQICALANTLGHQSV